MSGYGTTPSDILGTREHAAAAPDAPEGTRPSLPRRIVCWWTIAAVLPYVTIKLLWISGSTVGLVDLSAVHSRALLALNTMTFAMDAVAVFVVCALTYRWGARLPAWLLVPPMWVASGLLGAVVVVVPVQVAWSAATHTSLVGGAGFLRPWVYAVVYSGFIAQGLGLVTAFGLYSRSRWPMLRLRTAARSPRSSSHALRALAAAAVLSSAPMLYWGVGGTAGLPRGAAGGSPTMLDIALGAAALLAASGAVALDRGLLRRPVLALWFGSAAMVAWGLWIGALAFIVTPVNSTRTHDVADALPQVFASAAQVGVGAALALLALRTVRSVVRSQVTEPGEPASIES